MKLPDLNKLKNISRKLRSFSAGQDNLGFKTNKGAPKSRQPAEWCPRSYTNFKKHFSIDIGLIALISL
jgi:hypothetical protein